MLVPRSSKTFSRPSDKASVLKFRKPALWAGALVHGTATEQDHGWSLDTSPTASTRQNWSSALTCVDLERARQAHAEAAKPPADHRGVPILAAVHIGEAAHHLNRDRATRRKAAVTCPKTHSLGSDRPHALHDEIQRLIPTCAAPGIRAAIITNLGVQQSFRIAKNLVGATPAHAKEALTVRIALVTADGLELATFHLDQHSAKRWMTIHGTHGPDDFRAASSHDHLRLRPCV